MGERVTRGRRTVPAPNGTLPEHVGPDQYYQTRRAYLDERRHERNKRRGRRHNAQKLTVEKIKEALIASQGNVLLASERLGCTRANVYYHIQSKPELVQLQAELGEEELDEHEAALRFLALKELHPTAILATLNAKGRNRGYGRGADVVPTSQIQAGDTHYHLHLHSAGSSKLAKVSDDDLNRLIEERRAALPQHDEHGQLVTIIPPPRRSTP